MWRTIQGLETSLVSAPSFKLNWTTWTEMAFENLSKDKFERVNDVGLVYTSDRFGRVRFPPGYNHRVINCNKESDLPALKGARCSSASVGDAIHSPLPLYQICLDFVAQNIEMVESLEDFPDIVGRQLFQKVHECSGFTDSPHVLQLFFKAYGELVLRNLSLSGEYMLANNKLEQLLVFSCLHALDLSHCRLGSDHELLSCVGNIESLQMLNLKDNCLTDDAVTRLSLPHRLLRSGLGKLLVLDLSCNPSITDNSIRCLLKFRFLEALNLSGTAVTFRFGVAKLVNTTNLQLTIEAAEFQDKFTTTEGWAAGVIDGWIELSKKNRKKEHHAQGSGARGFYQANTTRTEVCKQVKVSNKKLFDGRSILLKAKKEVSGEVVDRFSSNQSSSSYCALNSRQAVSAKRKSSSLPSTRNKRSNCQIPTLVSVDSEEDWAFLSGYVVKPGAKQNTVNCGATPLLLDALDRCKN